MSSEVGRRTITVPISASPAAYTKPGFKPSLVGGATVYGWAAEAVLETLGDEWLRYGWGQVSYRRPVYQGEQISVRLVEDGSPGYAVEVLGPEDDLRVTGRAGLDDAPWFHELETDPSAPSAPPSGDTDEPRRVLTFDHPGIGEWLAPMPLELTEAATQEVASLKQHSSDERFVGPSPMLHPSMLANFLMTIGLARMDLGPAVLVSNEIQHLGSPTAGPGYFATAAISEVYERRGRHYGRMIGSLYLGDQEVARARQDFIFAM